MRFKKILGSVFLVLGIKLIILFGFFSITGGVVNENEDLVSSLFSFLGLVLIAASFFLFVSKHSLDAIIVPTGPGNEEAIRRAERAYRENQGEAGKYFVISGAIHDKKDPSKNKFLGSQSDKIYRNLRRHGIKRSDIEIEPLSRNSVENVVHSLEKIKERGGTDVGIVSYPNHLDRFKDIFEKAKEEGILDGKFRLYRIPTKTRKGETSGEKIYETLSGVLHWYKLRGGVRGAMESENNYLIGSLKKMGSALLKPFKR